MNREVDDVGEEVVADSIKIVFNMDENTMRLEVDGSVVIIQASEIYDDAFNGSTTYVIKGKDFRWILVAGASEVRVVARRNPTAPASIEDIGALTFAGMKGFYGFFKDLLYPDVKTSEKL